jgi:hypothetical protein
MPALRDDFHDLVIEEVVKQAVRAQDNDVTLLEHHPPFFGVRRMITTGPDLVWRVESVRLLSRTEGHLVSANDHEPRIAQVRVLDRLALRNQYLTRGLIVSWW